MNAVKFTPRNGCVQLYLQRVTSHVEIVVSDDGPGIPPEVLPFIFEPFRQGDSSSTRAHSGLGLGLALVRHLVDLVMVEEEGHPHDCPTPRRHRLRIVHVDPITLDLGHFMTLTRPVAVFVQGR